MPPGLHTTQVHLPPHTHTMRQALTLHMWAHCSFCCVCPCCMQMLPLPRHPLCCTTHGQPTPTPTDITVYMSPAPSRYPQMASPCSTQGAGQDTQAGEGKENLEVLAAHAAKVKEGSGGQPKAPDCKSSPSWAASWRGPTLRGIQTHTSQVSALTTKLESILG